MEVLVILHGQIKRSPQRSLSHTHTQNKGGEACEWIRKGGKGHFIVLSTRLKLRRVMLSWVFNAIINACGSGYSKVYFSKCYL